MVAHAVAHRLFASRQHRAAVLRRVRVILGLVVLLFFASTSMPGGEESNSGTIVYSEEQAHKGHDLYDEHCASCHGAALEGQGSLPLSGMQVENDYDKDVYNGDLGIVLRIDMEEGELNVDFDGREVTYGFGELDELVLAYATTIHKSQGSEYPAVVIPLSTQHYPMLQRNLVYTGVTRGKRLVVLIGQRKALAIAVKGARARRRWSKLREWLIGSATPSANRFGI